MSEIGVLPPKPPVLREMFGVAKPILGMIHLLPLPGAPRFAGGALEPVLAKAREAGIKVISHEGPGLENVDWNIEDR